MTEKVTSSPTSTTVLSAVNWSMMGMMLLDAVDAKVEPAMMKMQSTAARVMYEGFFFSNFFSPNNNNNNDDNSSKTP